VSTAYLLREEPWWTDVSQSVWVFSLIWLSRRRHWRLFRRLLRRFVFQTLLVWISDDFRPSDAVSRPIPFSDAVFGVLPPPHPVIRADAFRRPSCFVLSSVAAAVADVEEEYSRLFLSHLRCVCSYWGIKLGISGLAFGLCECLSN